MRRRELLLGGIGSAALAGTAAKVWTATADAATPPASDARPERLVPPAKGKIPVAFVISDGATMIDFTGPWEVFQDCHVMSRGATMDEMMPFELFTVAETAAPVRATGGMQIVPDYTVDDAPAPRLIVVPAHRSTPRLREWIVKASATADLTMSVCTGAFALAKAGLLKGLPAMTHHDFLDRLEKDFPDVQVRRGLRFVESSGRIATAGGLTSGIDLALRVVERYFGREVAEWTASYMEYQSTGWKV
jgi:transcriptional regulator GlxA family with amidase domain